MSFGFHVQYPIRHSLTDHTDWLWSVYQIILFLATSLMQSKSYYLYIVLWSALGFRSNYALSVFTEQDSYHTCALDTDATRLKCFGKNEYGQLGYGDVNNRGDGPNEMGVVLQEVDLGTDVFGIAHVATGNMHTCVVTKTNQTKCFGRNDVGQLGYGDTTNRGDGPNEMGDNLPFINLGTAIAAPIQISAGHTHTCVLFETNNIKCFGKNQFGELGCEDTVDRGANTADMGDNLPFLDLGTDFVAIQIATGLQMTCALSQDGRVKAWGYNFYGQLGLGDTNPRGTKRNNMGNGLDFVDLGANFVAIYVGAGISHACALSNAGRVKCWGRGTYGPLGYGDVLWRGDVAGEMGDNLPFVDLGSDFNVTQMTTGGSHNCAMSTDSRIKCWGNNNHGQLGYGDTTIRGDDPNEMGDNLPFVDLGVGFMPLHIKAGQHHTCAWSSTQMKCWGNNQGQLGYGDGNNRGDVANEMGDGLPFVDLGFDGTKNPTEVTSMPPTGSPSSNPTYNPTKDPSQSPTDYPTIIPSADPTNHPSNQPSSTPTDETATSDPSQAVTMDPTSIPSKTPITVPSDAPSSDSPSSDPSDAPSDPTESPSGDPTDSPSSDPSESPSSDPTDAPSSDPSNFANATLSDVATVNYTIYIGLNCDEDSKCNVHKKALEERILIAIEGEVTIFSSEIRNDEVVVSISITAESNHVLQTSRIEGEIEREIKDDNIFGDVKVEETESNDDVQNENEFNLMSRGVLIASVSALLVICCCVLAWICIQKRRKRNRLKVAVQLTKYQISDQRNGKKEEKLDSDDVPTKASGDYEADDKSLCMRLQLDEVSKGQTTNGTSTGAGNTDGEHQIEGDGKALEAVCVNDEEEGVDVSSAVSSNKEPKGETAKGGTTRGICMDEV